MRLKNLLFDHELENKSDKRFFDSEVMGITSDSRKVKPGFLFVALEGEVVDGNDFIIHAIESGAIAILSAKNTLFELTYSRGVLFILDPTPRQRYAKMVGRFYAPQPQYIAAVTGTNGKSSVAEFTRQIWQACGQRAASIGTLGLISPRNSQEVRLTTPDPIDLHKTLTALRQDRVEHVIVEASSHGLTQFRVDGIDIKVAAFTNLSRDHLDYHGTMDDYFNAKLRLFTELLNPEGVAVINSDDNMTKIIISQMEEKNIRVIDFGKKAENIVLKNTESLPEGQKISINVFGRDFNVLLPLMGEFQVMNVLCALGIAIGSGLEPEQAEFSLVNLRGVRGRMELAGTNSNGSRVFVDYAHTPAAITSILISLRAHTKNKLKILFGCGGNRDPGKRAEMGRIAAQLADTVIITDDNPRNEDATAIRDQIKLGSPDAIEIPNRMDAISNAIKGLSADDVLIIAGKGHEKGQIIGDAIIPFDDVSAVKSIIGEKI